MGPYTPEWRKHKVRSVKATPLPGLTARAAEGLLQAAEDGLIDNESWLVLVRVWDRVTVTAG